mmetsp:Transcript_9640/g.12510  ORF Transcript_9640/g.12510 Transcript_9640/m.12510 type:complete len:411 (-) Transcript_9640:110-1342(-)
MLFGIGERTLASFGTMGSKSISKSESVESQTTKWFLLMTAIPLFCIVFILPVLTSDLRHSFQIQPLTNPLTTGVGLGDLNKEQPSRHIRIQNHLLKKKSNQSCISYKRRTSDKIISVRVIGERNSGTSFLIRALSKHLPNVTVGGGLSRGRHWFQSAESLKIFSNEDLKNILVIVLTRSPYEWILNMQENPRNAISHVGLPDWRHFVSKPWTTRNSIRDKHISSLKGAHCQEHFLSGEVIPCRRHDTVAVQLMKTISDSGLSVAYPVYEMHPKTHKAFRSIKDFRRAKMLNFYNMSKWVPNIRFIQAEMLTTNDGLLETMQMLQNDYSLGICEGGEMEKLSFKQYLADPRGEENKNFFKWYSCNGHWPIEEKFGYRRKRESLYYSKGKKKFKFKCSASPFDSKYSRKSGK